MAYSPTKTRLIEALMPVQCRTCVCPWLGVLNSLHGDVPLRQVRSLHRAHAQCRCSPQQNDSTSEKLTSWYTMICHPVPARHGLLVLALVVFVIW